MSLHWTPARSELHTSLNGLSLDDVTNATKAVSAKPESRQCLERPLVTPIYQTSTYKMPSVDHYLKILNEGGYIYSRLGNPTCEAAESAISALEGGAGTLIFPTGMAAITTTLLTFVKAGDHVVCCNPVYSGTHSFIGKHLANFNVEVTWVSGVCVQEYKEAVRPNTKVLYGETPGNPLMSILDLEAFGALGQSLEGVVTMVDSTFGSPYLQQPIKHGIDLVLHSGTKYMGGHSDLVAGVASCRTLDQWKKLMVWRTTMGTTLSPSDAALLSRGVKTLALRMERHSDNAQKCAEFLASHPKVEHVYYPGLPQHPGHEVARRQMAAFSGMIAFEMKGGLEPARRLVEGVRLITLAVSLGGVESLVEHPATMTHGPMVMDDAERREGLITDGLIRLSVGVEDAVDLVKDLKQALDQV